jgi:hypothetical protein
VRKGPTIIEFRDCLTVDYASISLPGGYEMKIRFSGPGSDDKDFTYNCSKVVDDSQAFLDDAKKSYEDALEDGDLSMNVKCLR